MTENRSLTRETLEVTHRVIEKLMEISKYADGTMMPLLLEASTEIRGLRDLAFKRQMASEKEADRRRIASTVRVPASRSKTRDA